MKIGDRLLLIFTSLVFFALSVLLCVAIFYQPVFQAISAFVFASKYIKIALCLVLMIMAVLAVRIMFSGVGKKKEEATLVSSTGEGGIYINLDTISDLAAKAVKKVEGVREIRVKTFIKEDGTCIAVKVSLYNDVVIPEICALVQKSVKSDVEGYCGLSVKTISVQVDNSLQSQK